MLSKLSSSCSRAMPFNFNKTLFRSFSSDSLLKAKLREIMPKKQAALKQLNQDHGDKVIGTCNVSQAIGGMRSVKCMLRETSLLDTVEGIRFRGYTIPELQEKLPVAKHNATAEEQATMEPIPEGLLWLLLTGEIPTEEEVRAVTADLHARAALPEHVEPLMRSLPKDMHPMTQLATGVLACQTDSQFAAAYRNKIAKKDYWEPVLEDTLNCIARLPRIAALIYRNVFHDGQLPADDPSLDYAANYARLLGYPAAGFPKQANANGRNDSFDELMRLYITIHSDHEGGNVSAHTTHLVGSALSDPYYSYAAGLCGLAGPLHGLANQEVLKWTLEFQQKIAQKGQSVTKESVAEQAWATLNSGNVIPGFGHAVLRRTDPRYTCQREYALKHMPQDELFKLVSTIYEVVPGVLTEHGKTKNPWPNVDAHSGCLLTHYGLSEYDYYTVLFGVSRAFGALSQLFWDRVLMLPLERPKSVTSEWISNQFAEEDKFSGFSTKDGQFEQTSVNMP